MDQGQRYLSDPRAAVRDGSVVKINDLFYLHRDAFLAGFEKLFGVKPKGILEALQPYVQNDSPIVGAVRGEARVRLGPESPAEMNVPTEPGR